MKQSEIIELLKEMTVDEKIGQLVQITGDFFNEESQITGPMENMNLQKEHISKVGSVIGLIGSQKVQELQKDYLENSRLKIPLLFMSDIIHGTNTIFPIPLALSSAFCPELVENVAKYAAKEAYLQGCNITFSPMADLAYDARWGRNMETSGEDTYLSSQLMKAYVKGYQQKDEIGNYKFLSCTKHFAGYGLVQSGRDYNTVDVSKRFLKEFHYPIYESAIKEGTKMMMSAFNTINSIPAVANKELLINDLRQDMDFDGVIISDWGAIKELTNHQVAKDDKEAAKLAIQATTDIDMMTPCYQHNLKKLIEEKQIEEKLLDESVLRILNLKNDLGLFENPYGQINTKEANEFVGCNEIKKLALQAAHKSCVLLKNNNNILPLNKNEKILIVGPLVNTQDLFGSWSIYGQIKDVQTIKEYFESQNENIHFMDYNLINNQIDEISSFDKVIYFGGETQEESGEANSKVDISLDDYQQKTIQKLKSLNKQIIFVNFSGRPMDLVNINLHCESIIQAWFLGTMTAQAIYDILYGNVNPSGKLTMSFPKSVGQCPISYKEFQTGRPVSKAIDNYVSKYIDEDNEPLFSFGEGLTYSNAKIKEVTYKKEQMHENETIDIEIEVENNSDYDCEEIVLLYVNDLVAKVIRPLKELKQFKRINIKAKSFTKLKMTIDKSMLEYYDQNCQLCLDKGDFEILIGLNPKKLNKKIITLK